MKQNIEIQKNHDDQHVDDRRKKRAAKLLLPVDAPHGADYIVSVSYTHLDVYKRQESRRARAGQLAELKAWVAELGAPDRPFIICGDFNIQGLAAERAAGEYGQLISALDGFTDLGAESDLQTYHPHPEGNPLAHLFEKQSSEQRLDYIFLRPAAKATQIVTSEVRRFFDRPLGSLGEGISSWASDHYGLKATFEI